MEKYEVVWGRVYEANSAAEAAFLAFKEQKRQNPSKTSFTVSSSKGILRDVRITSFAEVSMMTDREQQVALLIMQGASNADIAKELCITPRTVKAHISHIFEKLHVGNRVKLATKLIMMENETRRSDVTV